LTLYEKVTGKALPSVMSSVFFGSTAAVDTLSSMTC
jgi:hypothetical protein